MSGKAQRLICAEQVRSRGPPTAISTGLHPAVVLSPDGLRPHQLRVQRRFVPERINKGCMMSPHVYESKLLWSNIRVGGQGLWGHVMVAVSEAVQWKLSARTSQPAGMRSAGAPNTGCSTTRMRISDLSQCACFLALFLTRRTPTGTILTPPNVLRVAVRPLTVIETRALRYRYARARAGAAAHGPAARAPRPRRQASCRGHSKDAFGEAGAGAEDSSCKPQYRVCSLE